MYFSVLKQDSNAQDIMVRVTVPGAIISAGGTLYDDLAFYKEQATGAVWDEPYGLVSLSPSSITFSAGGALYKQTATNADDISGVWGWSCSSITFVATSTTGSVSFADASLIQVAPGVRSISG